MAIFKCKMCGGSLEINETAKTAVCEYCGTEQTLPRLDNERVANLYDRANHFRRNNDFDKAMGIYEQILTEDKTDAEAYWSLVLCRYGIEYVEDPASHKRVPTVNRAQYTSIFDDDNYKSALQYADMVQCRIYKAEAEAINEIQKNILAISQNEEPFDVFICYKETDNNGRRTQDSVLANDLYHQLTQEGFKVFFSRITLEDKLGTAYEPYIFAALNSAKVMVVIGTKPEHFNAVWVKNEWSRYLALVKNGAKKILIPAYRDMDPYDLPEEFSHLQAQDMSKLGFMQDLIRGIKKITGADEPKAAPATVRETVVVENGGGNASALLKRAFMALEDGEFPRADDFCEQVLNIDAECAEAYLGKLMAQLKVRRQADLARCSTSFENNKNYKKVIRFGSVKLTNELKGYVRQINERIAQKRQQEEEERCRKEAEREKEQELLREKHKQEEEAAKRREQERLKKLYDAAVADKEQAQTAEAFLYLKNRFYALGDYSDARKHAAECRLMADKLTAERDNNRIYAKSSKTLESVLAAHERLLHEDTSGGVQYDGFIGNVVSLYDRIRKTFFKKQMHRPSTKIITGYEQIIHDLDSISEWKDSLSKIKLCEQKLAEIKAWDKKRLDAEDQDRKDLIVLGKKAAAFSAAFVVLLIAFIIVLVNVIIPGNRYNKANELIETEQYAAAAEYLEKISGYKDSRELLEECYYQIALDLQETGKYAEAADMFERLEGYKDSNDRKTDSQYNNAVSLTDVGLFDEAYEIFMELGEYKDSVERSQTVRKEVNRIALMNCAVGDNVIFGTYEQDNDTANGQEEIEWTVLARTENRALLFSRYVLDSRPYNTSYALRVTWETCTLRKWLNNEFLNTAFSESDKAMLVVSEVAADYNPNYNTNPGNSTQDKVFILSLREGHEYFYNNDLNSIYLGVPTKYAKAVSCTYRGESFCLDGEKGCRWWLRTPGKYSSNALICEDAGDVSAEGYDVDFCEVGVRPALWVELNTGIVQE